MLSKVSISNFKSIKHIDLDCKKINLFIGKPNVGKSNILEALSLFQKERISNVRLETMRNLFYDQDLNNQILIEIDDLIQFIGYHSPNQEYKSYILRANFFKNDNKLYEIKKFLSEAEKKDYVTKPNNPIKARIKFSQEGVFNGSSSAGEYKHLDIKKYSFNKDTNFLNKEYSDGTLRNPFGENLFEILKSNKQLLHEIAELFKEYGYGLVIDFITNEAEIQKMVQNISYKIPYSLIADTLQRIVFYMSAIRSNSNCTILLEEPENHSFPPYIRNIAHEIINSSNQFFIATHSPYLLNTIMADAKKKDVNINIVSYSDYKTTVKTMSEEEISELSNYGIDVFFNLDIFSE